MLLSIVLLNVRNVERHKKYLDATLSVLDRQIAFRCAYDDVEILMVSDPSYSVDQTMFPTVSKIIKYVPSHDLISGVRDAVKVASGTHITFIDNYCGVKYVGAINSIVDTIEAYKNKNIVFPVDVTTVGKDTSYRYLVGKVMLAGEVKDIISSPSFVKSGSPAFHLAHAMDNRIDLNGIYSMEDVFIRYSKLSVTPNNVMSVNTSMIDNSYESLHNLQDKYVSEILNTIYDMWSNCKNCNADLVTIMATIRKYFSNIPNLMSKQSLKFLSDGPEEFKNFISILEEELND
jgi:hypothetical protein